MRRYPSHMDYKQLDRDLYHELITRSGHAANGEGVLATGDVDAAAAAAAIIAPP